MTAKMIEDMLVWKSVMGWVWIMTTKMMKEISER